MEICGDSMTKYIQAHKLGRSTNDRVTSKSFSGAKCKDMKHYIMPTIEKKPDEIIRHVGTNDLKTSSAKTVVKDIMALKDFVVKTSPNTKVTINLVPRIFLWERPWQRLVTCLVQNLVPEGVW
jgi:hypothetical protein